MPVRLYLPDGPVIQDLVPPLLDDGEFGAAPFILSPIFIIIMVVVARSVSVSLGLGSLTLVLVSDDDENNTNI